MAQFLKYFPLTKVDESTHTISGIATAEVPDKDGEIADYEWCKTKAYPAWSQEAADSTKAAGQELSYGNIRVQHTLEIGGKVKAPPVFDDENKSIHIDTEPENDAIFAKAQKGFIRGFSHGGDYAWRQCNECGTDIAPDKGRECSKCKKTVFVRYGPILSEVSYVDNPCLKQATFSLVKADGSTQIQKFQEGSSATMEPKEQTGAKATPPAFDLQALAAEVTKSVLAKLGKSVKYLVTDGDEKHLPYTGDDGTPNHRLMGAAWAALHQGYRGKKYAGPDKDKALERLKAVYEKEGLDTPEEKAKKVITGILDKAAGKRGLQKGLYDVSRFAELLQSLAYLRMGAIYERDSEEDDSTLPEDLLADLESLAETFLAMAEEETQELTAIAGGKGHTHKMNNNSALAKATKSLAEHIEKAKKAVSEHCDKMCKAHETHKAELHECFDKLQKSIGGTEPEPKAAGDSSEPEPIDPMKEGTPGSMKAAEGTFTKAQVDELLQKTVNETVQALVKAMTEPDDEEDDDEKKSHKKTVASGIGERSNAVIGNAGPVVKVHPVSKAQDTQAASAAASAEPLSAADVAAAMSGDSSAALKFMKGVQSENGVPATVAGALSSVKR